MKTLFIILLLISSSALFAQDSCLQGKRPYTDLPNAVVSARHPEYVIDKTSESIRLNLPLLEVPQNIEIVSHQLLADQGLLTLSEAIRNVSGVIKDYGGLNDYSTIIRGTDITWNVFRNGVGGYFWNQQEDAAMIDNIEFIKGPAAFMVSIAQPGGIINSNTKQPGTEQIASVNAGFGSYNTKRITSDFGGRLSKNARLSYRLNAGAQTQDRDFQHSNASRYFICAAVKYDFDRKTTVTAEYNYMLGKTDGNNVGLPSVNGKMFSLPRDFAVANAATDNLTTTDQYYRLQIKHRFSEHWHLNAQLAYVHGRWGGYSLNADEDVPVSNDTLYRASSYDDERNYSAVIQAYIDGVFHTGRQFEHKVLIGIDYCNAGFTDSTGGTWGEEKYGLYLARPEYAVSQDSLKNFFTEPKSTVRWGWTSLYIQDNVKVAGKLIVTLAAHDTHAPLYGDIPAVPDYQKNTHYNIIAPKIGLTWLLSKNISIYAMYDQCFWPQEAKNFERKTFLPLTGVDIETGIKAYFIKKRLSLNLSVYDFVQNNTLTDDPLHNGYFIQTGQIISRGIEFDMTGNITPALMVNANYACTNAKITRDSDPDMVGMKNFAVPDNYCNLWLQYSLLHGPLKNLSFAMGCQMMGQRSAVLNWTPGDEIKNLPAYNLLDAALSYHNGKYYIRLNLYNMTNIQYAVIGSFNSATDEWRYTPGEPINFRLSFGVSLVRAKK